MINNCQFSSVCNEANLNGLAERLFFSNRRLQEIQGRYSPLLGEANAMALIVFVWFMENGQISRNEKIDVLNRLSQQEPCLREFIIEYQQLREELNQQQQQPQQQQ